MTSTLAVYEPFVANRPTKDARTLEAMTPPLRDTYLQIRHEIDSSGSGPVAEDGFKHAMAFERAFVAAGGSLARAWTRPAWAARCRATATSATTSCSSRRASPPQQAVQIMTANGAKVLGVEKQLGSVERGKLADLVVLKGDLTADPAVIRNPMMVFKDGIGYDPAKLIASVQGRVGID